MTTALRPTHQDAAKSRCGNCEKEIAGERLEDRGTIELRLERLQARYPQMKEFYDLELRDTG